MSLNMTFHSVRELTEWLEKKNRECESPDEYYEWLWSFFEDGNTITVRDVEYDYAACWELF